MDSPTDLDLDLVGSDEDLAIIDPSDLRPYNAANILPEPPAIISKLRQWLQPTSYHLKSSEYHKHLASHLPGTGQWLSATPSYRAWHDGADHGLLWIKGIPGSGKSVFAAALANELATKEEGHPVLFFFFRQIIDANHKPVQMLRDWLDQVLEYSPLLQKELREEYMDEEGREMTRALESVGLEDLWGHLKTALGHMERVYLVADALDEMDAGNDGFLKTLAGMGSWKPGSVKVLITSRPVASVEIPLREANVPMRQVRLEERFVDVDIAAYVDNGLEASNIPVEDRVLVKEAVPGRANGLFLYAKLAMDAFLEPHADVRQVLSRLPADLHAMYTDLLREHARRSGVPDDIQFLILSWVTHATRPLRLLEMAEMMMATWDGVAKGHNLKGAKDLVRAACGPLLEIYPDETVGVVHHSFTEFLVGSTRTADAEGFPILMAGPTNEQLALSCLRYLISISLDGYEVSDDIRDKHHRNRALKLQYPFFEYAAKNWPVHVAKSAGVGLMSTALSSILDEFLTPGPRFLIWLDMERPDSQVKDITPSHVAARYGLTNYLKLLVSRGSVQVDCVDSIGDVPLFYAAEKGHAGAAQVLIDAGANPDKDNCRGFKPLHLAAKYNHASVVSTLLAAGVHPLTPKTMEQVRMCGNAPRTKGHTALMYACEAGHVEAVEAFLPFLDMDMVSRSLYWAARSGKPELVKRLIQHPDIDINAKYRGDTPLFSACSSGNVECIRSLVLAGADASILSRNGSDEFVGVDVYREKYNPVSALEKFCMEIRTMRANKVDPDQVRDGLDLLLRAGADINRCDSFSKTPLHHAAGNPLLLRLLLSLGANPNAETEDGSTLLHTPLAGEEGLAVTRLLVDRGADVNKRQRHGKTPAMMYLDSSRGYDDCLRFVTEFAPDCTITDNNGDSLLILVAKHRGYGRPGREELMDKLVEAGATHQPNHHGETPVHVADDMDVVRHLVKLGADLEAQDNEGRTPLMLRIHRWCGEYRHPDQPRDMEDFVAAGARLDTRDFRGRTLLHEAVQLVRQYTGAMGPADDGPQPTACPVLKKLIALGLDPKVVDYSGNTLLHELAKLDGHPSKPRPTHIALFEELVHQHGLNPDVTNRSGQTVLHLLCTRPTETNISLLKPALAACRNVNAATHDGIRPIHLAASVSDAAVSHLIDAGADIAAATNEGLTPLHLAALGRCPNIVGMLLAAMATTGKYREGMVGAVDKAGCTPLYYACRSGRPESVALLLQAGARVSSKLLEACAGFEGEDKLWERGEGDAWSGLSGRLDDKTRPNRRTGTAHKTARLDEIVGLLVENGLDVAEPHTNPSRPPYLVEAIHAAVASDFDYTAACLRRLEIPSCPYTRSGSTAVDFLPRRAALRREAAAQAFREVNPLLWVEKNSERQSLLLDQLFARREYELIETAVREGLDVCAHNPTGQTLLHRLAFSGYSQLLARIATKELVKTLESDEWREGQENGEGIRWKNGPIHPLVLRACECPLPNMAVLRFLVETIDASVDANGQGYWWSGRGYVREDAPLHVLARGAYWWQVEEALPYLLSKKPDLSIRNANGASPLHAALGGLTGFYSRKAAIMLVEAGADVNALDDQGHSPLDVAVQNSDHELIRRLIANGARVTATTLFVAVANGDVELLELLLSSGADPNMRRGREEERKHPAASVTMDDLMAAWLEDKQDFQKQETYLLSYAATTDCYKLPNAAEMVRVLLSHGADPFAQFWNPAKEKNGRDLEQLTVIHEILRHNGVLEPFFELPASSFNIEHRDSHGRTLLHAACLNPSTTFAATIHLPNTTEPQPLINLLLHRGADPTALDTSSRTPLHLLFLNLPQTNYPSPTALEPFTALLTATTTASRTLLNHLDQPPTGSDDPGRSPLHHALRALFPIPIALLPDTNLHTTLIPALLTAGASPTSRDSAGNTPLHYLAAGLADNTACRSLFPMFLSLDGVDANAKNALGETPVFWFLRGEAAAGVYDTPDGKRYLAVWGEEQVDEEGAWELLEGPAAGVDFKARDYSGRGLLHVVAGEKEEGEKAVGRFGRLVERWGLDVGGVDGGMRSALDVAAACGNEGVLAMFGREGEGRKRGGEDGIE